MKKDEEFDQAVRRLKEDHEKGFVKIAPAKEPLNSWERIPPEKLKEIDAQMTVFKGELIAKDLEFGWDPKHFKVKKISETEGVLVLESRGETT